MKNKIPFSLIPARRLKKFSQVFSGLGTKIERNMPSLRLYLDQSQIGFNPQEYTALSIASSIITFLWLNIILNAIFYKLAIKYFWLLALGVSTAVTLFIFMEQLLYPKLTSSRKIRDIEKNLLPALQDILVQLNSGIALFDIMVNISNEKYGEVSIEFAKAVKKISTGSAQVEVLDEMASKNPSLYFRRGIWQLVNGLKTGSDTGLVIKEIISSLSEEQLLQVQRYGGQLNPLAMFYMLTTVIMPSLGMTFLILLTSFLAPSEFITKLIFWSLYGLVFFFQVMFLGIIKTKRPTLLEK